VCQLVLEPLGHGIGRKTQVCRQSARYRVQSWLRTRFYSINQHDISVERGLYARILDLHSERSDFGVNLQMG
jgi:hypothetical protein